MSESVRGCPECGARMKPHGKAAHMPSGFVDQIYICTKAYCYGIWVKSWTPEPGEPAQLEFFGLMEAS